MEHTDSSSCPFCEWYNKLKCRDKYYEDGRDGRSCVTEFKYGAALVHETYYNGIYSGRSVYNPEPLNYCPTCGTKLDN